MSADEGALPDEGLSLWLTDYRMDVGEPWEGRRLVALVGQSAAGSLDFHVHPDGQAVRVWMLEVYPGFQRRGLASVLMDALYAAYPTAWINHGTRSRDDARWWNGYRDPHPRRNVHNRPPGEWAAYFDAVEVASDKAQLVHRNDHDGLDGHRDAVYRYGERGEQEADGYLPLYRPVRAAMLNPAAQPLHGATRLFLPPRLHTHVHDESQDAASRAEALLQHLGHDNLPRTRWYATRQQAFEDAHHEEVFQNRGSTQGGHACGVHAEPTGRGLSSLPHRDVRARGLHPCRRRHPRRAGRDVLA
ncbi:GNAT family N-acetyltransferase [Streptomyces sp. NPDC046870]|uniref:GNAT family N-acetyltransferase n=1 Tax=Streptomyces sp. NPDC046870 TaxID=3155135 RepID=UPI0034546B78